MALRASSALGSVVPGANVALAVVTGAVAANDGAIAAGDVAAAGGQPTRD